MKTAQAVVQNFRFLRLFFSYFFFGFNPKIQNGYRQYDSKKIRWKDKQKIQNYICPHFNILNLSVGLSIISVFFCNCFRPITGFIWHYVSGKSEVEYPGESGSVQPGALNQPAYSNEDFSGEASHGGREEWFQAWSCRNWFTQFYVNQISGREKNFLFVWM